MTPDLSIIVLSWNVADLLAGCLKSLPGAAGNWWNRTEVVVVDNASTDESRDMVRQEFPHVRLLPLSSNLGFSGGNNAGILASRGKYVLLLNADTVAHRGSIATLADYLDAHPDVGIAGPKLLNPDGTTQSSRRRFPTLTTALVESTPLQRWFTGAKVLRDFYMHDSLDDQSQDVDWLSGAALMCRRETLMQVGLLDPGYFMFSEEVDLCRRVKGAGWGIAYVPGAQIVHYGGQSTGQDVPSRHIHFNTSKARYFRLHKGTVAGRLIRAYLLMVSAAQALSEGAKWLSGHKRGLRRSRLKMYRQVLESGLREHTRERIRADSLLVTGEYPPARGGVGDYTCRLALALAGEGLQARVFTHRAGPGNQVGSVQERASSSTMQPPLRTENITARATLRALRFSRARIAHIQYQTGAYRMRPTVNLLPLLLRLRRGGPTVVTFHDLRVPYLFPKAGPVREWANRLMALSATAVVATNPEDADRLRAWGAPNVNLIPIGSNIENSPPPDYDRRKWREAHSIRDDTVLLAYFGFLNSSKGLEDLLHALADLVQQGDFRLVMVGGGLGSSDPTNRETARSIDALAARLGLRDRLLWTGYLTPEEVSAALLSADMAVLPYSDGASFRRGSLLAVMSHGLPLVTTRSNEPAAFHGSAGWPVLEDGKHGLLVAPGDTEGLTRAIQRLAADAGLRSTLSAGATEAASDFSWESIAQMHRRLYQVLLRENEQGR